MNVWKGVSLTLVCFMLLVVGFNLFHRRSSSMDGQTKAYYAALEDTKQMAQEQNKWSMEYIQKANESLEQSGQVTELSLRNEERFQKLIEHWEKQTDRLDNLISDIEKKVERP